MLAAGMLIAGDVKAAADPATGEAIFNRTCQNCHSIHIGVNKVGPSLYHVIGRKAGSVPGFEYSEAMKDSGQTWTPEELNVYLSNPRGTLHGVKMFFQGLNLESQRLDVIAYLQSLQ